jgi:hypothetical protein
MDRKVVEEGDRGLGGEGRGKEEKAQVRGNSNQGLSDQSRERGVLKPSRAGKEREEGGNGRRLRGGRRIWHFCWGFRLSGEG